MYFCVIYIVPSYTGFWLKPLLFYTVHMHGVDAMNTLVGMICSPLTYHKVYWEALCGTVSWFPGVRYNAFTVVECIHTFNFLKRLLTVPKD